MKNLKHIILFGAMALAAAACSREAVPETAPETVPEGNPVSVAFSVALPDEAVSTKATAIDPDDKLLWVYVFDEDGKPIPGLAQKLSMENGKANVQARLMEGITYTFAFWAASAAYDTDSAFQQQAADVEVNMNDIYGNGGPDNPNAEAFYGKATLTAGQTQLAGVTLKRPFAQVNLGIPYTDSLFAATSLGVPVEEVETRITVTLPTVFSLRNGTVGDSTREFASSYATCPWDRFIDVRDGSGNPVPAECFNRAASFYVLADDVHNQLGGSDASKLSLSVMGNQYTPYLGFGFTWRLGSDTAPIKPNQQTNILGPLFEGTVQPYYSVTCVTDGGTSRIKEGRNLFREGERFSVVFSAGEGVTFDVERIYYIREDNVQEVSLPYFHTENNECEAIITMPPCNITVHVVLHLL